MQRINMNRPLKARAVYLNGCAGNNVLRDVLIWIVEGFVIVASDEEDPPTLYNIGRIDRIEGVEQLTAPKGRTVVF